MASPIDPIRPGRPSRRTAKAQGQGHADAQPIEDIENLPVPVGPARTIPRSPVDKGDATFAAHLMGQEGQKRGLRGGPPVINAANTTYNRTEWSGEKDRRTAKGKTTKTDV